MAMQIIFYQFVNNDWYNHEMRFITNLEIAGFKYILPTDCNFEIGLEASIEELFLVIL